VLCPPRVLKHHYTYNVFVEKHPVSAVPNDCSQVFGKTLCVRIAVKRKRCAVRLCSIKMRLLLPEPARVRLKGGACGLWCAAHLYNPNSTIAVLRFRKRCLCQHTRLAKAAEILVQGVVWLPFVAAEGRAVVLLLLRVLFRGGIALPRR